MKLDGKRIGRTDITNFMTAIVFVFIYRYIHIDFLVKYFEYFGYCDLTSTYYEKWITNIIAIIPILLYSGREKASNYISILIYILIYVPIIITIQYSFSNYYNVINYQLVFLFAMCLFFLSDFFIYNKYSVTANTDVIPVKLWLWSGVMLSIIVLTSYGPSSLRLVSFEEVYDVRNDNQDVLDSNPIIGYFVLWISYVFVPLFAAIGLMNKKKSMIALSVMFALLIYMSTGSKATILAPFFAFSIFFCLKHIGFKYLFPTVVAGFLLVMIWSDVAGNNENKVNFMVASVLLLRTLGISGLLSIAYIDFFANNPYTYYSHIGIVNKITGAYPYGNDVLGKAVWSGFRNVNVEDAMNANANFLVTDGIAACGVFGVFFISIIFFLLLIYINKVTARYNQTFVFILLLGAVLSLLNVSLFTTLVSCGLLLLILFFRFSTVTNLLNSPKTDQDG